MNPTTELQLRQTQLQTRRHFLRNCQVGLGGLTLAQMLGQAGSAATVKRVAPKAKNIIYLHMAGSPPQHETFDYKPELAKRHMEPCPDELMANRSFPFIKGRPKLLGPQYKFEKHGESGIWISELFPKIAGHADKLCVIKSMFTDQFNHAPAQLLLHTGTPQFGGAAMGSWITYGLGSENDNLPGFIVMVSGGKLPSGGKQLWGSGFLPGVYQGVQCRSGAEPILFVNNPPGMSRELRRAVRLLI